MFDLYLRMIQQKVFTPIASLLARLFTPNQITLIAFVFGLLSSYYLFYSHNFLGILLFALNRIFDGLDGTVARLTNKQSDFGGYLDIVTDFIVYSLIPISLTLSNPSIYALTLLSIMMSTFFVNAASLFQLSALLEKRNLGSKANKEKTSVCMPPALIEGFETYCVYFTFMAFPQYKESIFIFFSICVSINVIQRLRWAYMNLV
ncbi:hypothetical protein SteCoe_18609 [Stentor coeruleus]|uniref:CDP-alcohol phosphatidyltransferase n=1 Tax=Stentor coeruleus TaxID=5963 RepID=A0A1R2BWH2_9CILI|nr:hypothetical protein SteCoe_18609 [Stentor coeruleus]